MTTSVKVVTVGDVQMKSGAGGIVQLENIEYQKVGVMQPRANVSSGFSLADTMRRN